MKYRSSMDTRILMTSLLSGHVPSIISVALMVCWLVGWLYWCFTALRHISDHFGRGQLT